jgi:hypothetical protein
MVSHILKPTKGNAVSLEAQLEAAMISPPTLSFHRDKERDPERYNRAMKPVGQWKVMMAQPPCPTVLYQK